MKYRRPGSAHPNGHSPSPHGEGGLKSHCSLWLHDDYGPSPHGEGGLKFITLSMVCVWLVGPSPHGEGGLKFYTSINRLKPVPSLPTRGGWIEMWSISCFWCWLLWSLPTRGGWIEIRSSSSSSRSSSCPSPHGEGGLKYKKDDCQHDNKSPSPHGEGGLKFVRHSYTP